MQSSESVEALSAAVVVSPFDTKLLYRLSIVHAENGNYPQAIQLLERVLRFERGTGHVYTALGHCYCMIKEDKRSVEAYKKALKFASQARDPEVYFGLGGVYLRNKEFREAVWALQRAVEKGDGYGRLADVYINLGKALEGLHRFTPAISNYTRGLALSPLPLQQALLHTSIARTLCKSKQKVLCLSSLNTAAQLAPGSSKVMAVWAWCDLVHGDNADGLEHAQKAMSLHQGEDEESADLHFLLGMCLVKLDKVDRAFSYIVWSVSKHPDSPLAWCVLGSLYGKKNQLREAHSCFLKSLQLDQTIPETLRNMAFLYTVSNRSKIADICLSKAGELMGDRHLKPINRYFYPYFEVGEEGLLRRRNVLNMSDIPVEKRIDLSLFSEVFIKNLQEETSPAPEPEKRPKLIEKEGERLPRVVDIRDGKGKTWKDLMDESRSEGTMTSEDRGDNVGM